MKFEKPETKLPMILNPVQVSAVAHGVLLNGDGAEHICESFFTLNGFLCMKNIRNPENAYSTIKQALKLTYRYIDDGVQISVDAPSRAMSQYGKQTSFVTLPHSDFRKATSYENQTDAPDWAFRTREQAIDIANEAEEHQNNYTRKHNKTIIEPLISYYECYYANHFFEKLTKLDLLFVNKEKWKKQLMKKNPVDVDILKDACEQLILQTSSTNSLRKFFTFERKR